jgi:hypothetical protein
VTIAYTERATQILTQAEREAQRFNHEFIGTEHVLLALVQEGSGVAARVLRNLDIDHQKILIQVERLLQHGPGGSPVALGRMPHTPRTSSALRLAADEARGLEQNAIGPEHLLLGLLREEQGVAAQVLIHLGAEIGSVRAEVRRWPAPACWLTTDVVALTRGIVADRAYDRLPILADALQEAGCDDPELISHLQRGVDHGCQASGCWVLDRVLAAVTQEPGAQPSERAKKQLKSDNYTVVWENAPTYGSDDAELEIGYGTGHSGILGWLRFQPGKDGVEVLSVKLDSGRMPFESKWPPDRAPVTVRCASLKTDTYSVLLHDIALINAAKLKPVERNKDEFSTSNFWASARLTTSKKTLIDITWAGYYSSPDEVKFAKPQACKNLARETVEKLDFKDHTLTDPERAWASEKFARDWKQFKDLEFHWWVRERYIETIGVVGDKAAYPVLRDILATEPPKGKPREASDGRCVYHAINAVTRLTKKDVRDKPVEQMDIEKTRLKVLDLIKAEK